MRVTFALSDAQYLANDRSGIMVGLPLTVQIDAGVLVMGADISAGWFDRGRPGQASLSSISLDRSVFNGRVAQLDLWHHQEDLFCQVLLDCGLSLRMDLLAAGPAPESHDTPYGIQTGEWLLGVAALQGLLAASSSDLLWQPVQGTIVDIQRLNLNPAHPGFGTLRWLHGLPRQPFAPDQVFITIEVR